MSWAPVNSSHAIRREVPRRWRILAVGLCALLVLPGCTTGMAYKRMDWLVSWYVNGLVDLDESQEAHLRRIVDNTMAWHRQTQLPKYVALAEELAAESNRPTSAAQLEARYQQVAGYLDDFLQHVIPDVAPLLRSLSASQLAELRENLAEDNEDMWDEYAGTTPEKRAARRAKTTLRVLQRFVGRLRSAQSAAVKADLAGMDDVSEQWLGRRRLWQEKFLLLVASPPPGAEFAAALQHMALNPNQFDSVDYRRQVDRNRGIVMGMLAELSTGLSDTQRQHLQRKFLEYAGDLQTIIGSP